MHIYILFLFVFLKCTYHKLDTGTESYYTRYVFIIRINEEIYISMLIVEKGKDSEGSQLVDEITCHDKDNDCLFFFQI